jgi:hypothetical protein
MHLQAWVAIHRRRKGWRSYATAAASCMPVLRFATPRSTLPLFPRDSLRAFLYAHGRLAVHSCSALSASNIIVSQYCERSPMGSINSYGGSALFVVIKGWRMPFVVHLRIGPWDVHTIRQHYGGVGKVEGRAR